MTWRFRGLGVLLTALTVASAGCSSPSTGGGATSAASPATEVAVPPQYSAPLAGLHAAELELAAGATHVGIRSAPAGAESDLFAAGVTGGGSPTLRVDTTASRVRISAGAPGTGDTTLGISLNPQVSWRIRLSGGASSLVLDLSGLRLSGLEIAGGAATMDVRLPRPEGSLPVAVSGGASVLRFAAAAGVPVQVTVTGGVSRVTIDGQTVEAPEQGRRITSGGYEAAADRYDIRLRAGASSFVLSRL